jgi:hypothetical protein
MLPIPPDYWYFSVPSFINFRGTGLIVNEIANLLEDEDEVDPLPQISRITLIPKMTTGLRRTGIATTTIPWSQRASTGLVLASSTPWLR